MARSVQLPAEPLSGITTLGKMFTHMCLCHHHQAVQGKWSPECCRNWTVLHVQCTTALSSGFPISQGNAEAPDRWGEKTRRHL